ncbi:MAG TPA: hypothetical protein VF257_16050 [Solirubrobacteraceae bacterium]
MAENTSRKPEWEERPDGTRVRMVNGIRIVDRSERSPGNDAGAPGAIEHLVARQEVAGQVVILGLDDECRVVYTTTLHRSLRTSD